MTVTGFRSQNHPQQVARRGALDSIDDRRTPLDLWAPLDELYRFTLDAAASPDNALCERFYTVADNGLECSWAGERVWCNPPFRDCGAWVAKASTAWLDELAEAIVMLLPANRTEQSWWQELVEPTRDRAGSDLRTTFLAGRTRFGVPAGTYTDPRGNRPPFGCVLLAWSRDDA